MPLCVSLSNKEKFIVNLPVIVKMFLLFAVQLQFGFAIIIPHIDKIGNS